MAKCLNISLFILVIFLVIPACKKKKNEESSLAPAATGPNTPYSVMQTYYHYADNGSTVTIDSSYNALFAQYPLGSLTQSYVSVGNVSLSDSALWFDGTIYKGYLTVDLTKPLKWSVTGSGTITAFTYSYIPSYPKYTGGNLLPDTCYKSSGISLNIAGVSNLLTSIAVTVSQGSSASVTKSLTSNGTVNFSTAELSSFSVNSNLYIEIFFINETQQTLGGVLHSFQNSIIYDKIAYLK